MNPATSYTVVNSFLVTKDSKDKETGIEADSILYDGTFIYISGSFEAGGGNVAFKVAKFKKSDGLLEWEINMDTGKTGRVYSLTFGL